MTTSEQTIRFCTSVDGARIAYATTGDGPPLVKAANWLSHLEFDWNSPVWRHWLTELSRHHTLIRYDERGCGLSDWDAVDFSIEGWVRDLEAVVDTLKLERFPLLGISQGGPIAILYTARHPERVSHLILYGSYARGRLKRNPSPQEAEETELWVQLAKLGWGKDNPAFRQVFTSLFIPGGTPEQLQCFNDLQRQSTSPENAVRIMRGFHEIDVTEVAQALDLPTLVLHAQGDLRVSFSEGRLLASLIPGARFVPLDSRNHILLETEPAWGRFLAEMRGFLGVVETDTREARTTDAIPAGRAARMGDTRWQQINTLFQRAVSLSPDERDRLLSRACAGDDDLRREVESLLEMDSKSGFTEELDGVLKGSMLSWHGAGEIGPGQSISHYEVIEKLGEGGMGIVFKARDRRLDRLIAVKLLPGYLSADGDVKRRFLQEARAAASLDHANVCTVFEIGETGEGQLYIAMPFYDGETIRAKVERGPLPVADAVEYARQVSEGVSRAHQAGIVHRDIKPANIIVTKDGQVKILDFGVAKLSDADITRSGIVLGTAAYMSPEQAQGKLVDRRTDLWSIGVLLYEMLAGRKPFSDEAGRGVLHAILHAQPSRVSGLRPDVPEALDMIVMRLLQKDPAGRFDSAGELVVALKQVLESLA